MGFLDKLKSVATAALGAGAKVYVEVFNPSRQNPFPVRVKAVVGEQDLKIGRVYLKVEGLETAVVRSVPVARQWGGKVEVAHEDVTRSEQTFRQEMNIAGPQVLSANQGYEWEAEVQLPFCSLPSYMGRNARHEWRISAGLDTAGNDPDSGWVTIEIA